MADTSDSIRGEISAPDAEAEAEPASAPTGFFTGVAGQLLLYTVGLALLLQVLLFPVMIAEHRNTWLTGRAGAAELASLAAQSMPNHHVTPEFSRVFLNRAFILSIAADVGQQRETILVPEKPIEGTFVRMDVPDQPAVLSIFDTLGHFMTSEQRNIKLTFKPELTPYDEMEVIVSEGTLRRFLVEQFGAIVLNSLILSVLTGAVVYFMVYRIVVRPMQGITAAVTRFSEAPEAPEATRIELPYGRSDEIRRVLAALGAMQRTVSTALRQRKRLADLGEAVAKISHDLRNSLAAAQVLSDGLADSNDPQVRDAAPRLERAIQRAITLAEATLKYGRSETPLPNLHSLSLKAGVEEAIAEGVMGWPGVTAQVNFADEFTVMVDADHLHRIVTNIVRNAAKALSKSGAPDQGASIVATATHAGGNVVLVLEDNGPGIPQMIREKLFQPFSKAASDGGAGLGLAIARELARGMGGELELARSDSSGSSFALTLRAG